MCNQLSQFTIEKYVHLKGFLDINNCNELTAELKRLVDAKQTTKDSQCPTSEAIHGAMAFDKLLVDLLPHFEQASGKRLYPTYSYARLYKKGEKLKIHTDYDNYISGKNRGEQLMELHMVVKDNIKNLEK